MVKHSSGDDDWIHRTCMEHKFFTLKLGTGNS